MRKILGEIRITPEPSKPLDYFRDEYILETDQGFFWASDGWRSTQGLPSFLDTLRFAMLLRNIDANWAVEGDDIIGEIEAQLDKRGTLSVDEIAEWIREYRQMIRSAIDSNGLICEIEPGDFSERLGDPERQRKSEAKIMIYLGSGRANDVTLH